MSVASQRWHRGKERRRGCGPGTLRRALGEEAEVTPGEDLMQEHGVLERILLIYDEGARRIERAEQFEPAVIARAAGLIRRFVEDYHEKQEEQFVFPRLQAAHRELELIAILLRQHERGRQLTDEIIRQSGSGPSSAFAQLLRSFGRMYRPHAAREDTVLLPAFRDVMGLVRSRPTYRHPSIPVLDERMERMAPSPSCSRSAAGVLSRPWRSCQRSWR